MKYEPTDETYWKERKRLRKEHGVNMIHAGCYLNNYYDNFLCKDCPSSPSCEKIKESEEKRGTNA